MYNTYNLKNNYDVKILYFEWVTCKSMIVNLDLDAKTSNKYTIEFMSVKVLGKLSHTHTSIYLEYLDLVNRIYRRWFILKKDNP